MEDKKYTIIDELVLHKKSLHAAVEGKKVIPLKTKRVAIEFIPTSNDFTLIRVLLSNPDVTINYSYIPRTKKIVTKAKSLIPQLPSSQVTLPEKVKIEEVI